MIELRWWWVMTTLGSSACVGEAPGLPELVALESNETASTTGTEGTGVLDSSTTTGPVGECGNGGVEPGEECDGIDWQGATCESLGFAGGGLACGDGCTFDTSGCFEMCGNGDIDPDEECDGTNLAGQTCESLGFSERGLLCVGCQLDASSCGPPPGMVEVPGGEFEMGSNESSDEQPIRQVQVDRFWIDQTEVTVAAYEACAMEGRCTEPGTGTYCNWMVAGREGHPVNCVTWFQAEEYCAWAGKRLPTEAEWEKTARGTDARTYPWGDMPEPSCSHVVMDDAAAGGDGCGNGSTMEVGSKSPEGDSPYGAQDMAGNVWEWVSDWYASGYDPVETDNPTGPTDGAWRVVRGGSWYNGVSNFFRAARRGFHTPSVSFDDVGFRCTRTPPAAL